MSSALSPIIEILEARIAPAAVFVSATTAKYTDEDGDRVTVKFSKPILTGGVGGNVATILPTTPTGGGDVLAQINLAGLAAAHGTTITVSVVVDGNGDGLTTVGTIDATGLDLGAVNLKGDLATILAGDGTPLNGGLKSLTVTSFGRAATIAGNTPAPSIIIGSAGAVIVKTDFIGASLEVQAPTPAEGKLASLFVGGGVSAGTTSVSGNIIAAGDIGKITIRGSLVGGKMTTALIGSDSGNLGPVVIGGAVLGGSEQDSAFIYGENIASVSIGGVLQGGAGKNSGLISAGKLGPVTIGGSLFGDAGESSGGIFSVTTIASVKIAGAFQGGDGPDSGQIFGDGVGSITIGSTMQGGKGDRSGTILSSGNIGAVKIGGSLIGGGIDNTTDEAGEIRSYGGSIASVTIGGSAIAGVNPFCGSILAEGTLGPVKIAVNTFSGGGADFIIRAKGAPAGGNAIASVTVGGSVSRTLILGGFGLSNEAQNPNASIGAIKVGGTWTASSIVAGARNLGTDDALGGSGTNFDNFNFGDSHDNNYNATALITKIASITIGGAISGTTGGDDHYGFVAGQIGSLKVDGTLIPLAAAAATDNRAIGRTGDFRIHEV